MTGDRTVKGHVAHVIGSMRTGGAERALLGYLRASDRHDFRHTLTCLDGRGEMAPAVEAAGVPVVVVRIRHRSRFLGALPLARHEVPDLHWLAVGDGPLRTALAARVTAAGLDTAVTWAGLCGDVESLLPVMDVWVMSSVEEGLPVALLEAMACGSPIVATLIGVFRTPSKTAVKRSWCGRPTRQRWRQPSSPGAGSRARSPAG